MHPWDVGWHRDHESPQGSWYEPLLHESVARRIGGCPELSSDLVLSIFILDFYPSHLPSQLTCNFHVESYQPNVNHSFVMFSALLTLPCLNL